MTRYDGTLCTCPDCEYVPPKCDQCQEHDGSAEWHGLFLCDDCLEKAQKEDADDGPMD